MRGYCFIDVLERQVAQSHRIARLWVGLAFQFHFRVACPHLQ
jgi:hypothetical protein